MASEAERAYHQAYRQRPENRARRRELQQRPDAQARKRAGDAAWRFKQRTDPTLAQRQRDYMKEYRENPENLARKRALTSARYHTVEGGAKHRARSFKYRGGERGRPKMLKYFYNLTVEQYDTMLAAQGGKCAGCPATVPGSRKKNFSVDHDHACCPGKRSCGQCVRWLLCIKCNTLLGLANDSAERLMGLAILLESRNGSR